MPDILESVAAHLVICGAGREKENIEYLVRKLGISDNVTFTGFLSDEEFPDVYSLADVFAIPSESELQSIVTLEALASGLPVVATNKDGSVNGISLKVTGIVEGLNGPGGRDGYLHIDDAKELLRISGDEINEIAVRLKNMKTLGRVRHDIAGRLSQFVNKEGNPAFELHDWASLTPFSTIASIVDILIVTIKIVLISIVLISILNLMMMSVYERVSEIGTIAAIGTVPSKILSLFIVEGLILGVISAVLGTIAGVILLFAINTAHFHFSFGRMKDILLVTSISPRELVTISAIVILITLISSFQPALKASKMEPVEALRHV